MTATVTDERLADWIEAFDNFADGTPELRVSDCIELSAALLELQTFRATAKAQKIATLESACGLVCADCRDGFAANKIEVCNGKAFAFSHNGDLCTAEQIHFELERLRAQFREGR